MMKKTIIMLMMSISVDCLKDGCQFNQGIPCTRLDLNREHWWQTRGIGSVVVR